MAWPRQRQGSRHLLRRPSRHGVERSSGESKLTTNSRRPPTGQQHCLKCPDPNMASAARAGSSLPGVKARRGRRRPPPMVQRTTAGQAVAHAAARPAGWWRYLGGRRRQAYPHGSAVRAVGARPQRRRHAAVTADDAGGGRVEQISQALRAAADRCRGGAGASVVTVAYRPGRPRRRGRCVHVAAGLGKPGRTVIPRVVDSAVILHLLMDYAAVPVPLAGRCVPSAAEVIGVVRRRMTSTIRPCEPALGSRACPGGLCGARNACRALTDVPMRSCRRSQAGKPYSGAVPGPAEVIGVR